MWVCVWRRKKGKRGPENPLSKKKRGEKKKIVKSIVSQLIRKTPTPTPFSKEKKSRAKAQAKN